AIFAAVGLGRPYRALAAAPPANDAIGGATVVGALPFHDMIDTTGATTDVQDEQAVAGPCFFSPTSASVWYRYTATAADSALFVDASASDYPVGVVITTRSPGSLAALICGGVSAGGA